MALEAQIAEMEKRLEFLESRIRQAESLAYTTEAVSKMINEANQLRFRIGMAKRQLGI